MDRALGCFDTALDSTAETGLRFYDAELLRLRSHVQADPSAREADLAEALSLAGRQNAALFELRSALDDFELCGDRARVALIDALDRIPSDSALPDAARARELLRDQR